MKTKVTIILLYLLISINSFPQKFNLGEQLNPNSAEFTLLGISSSTGVSTYHYIGAITDKYYFGRKIDDIVIGVKGGMIVTTIYNVVPESGDIGVPKSIIDLLQNNLPFPLAYADGIYGVIIDDTSISVRRTNNVITFHKDRIMFLTTIKNSLLTNEKYEIPTNSFDDISIPQHSSNESKNKISLIMEAPKSIEVGKQFRLVFKFNEQGSNLQLPSGLTNKFDILMGPSTDHSTSIQTINGKTTTEVIFSYTFILRAKIVGIYDINPANITFDDRIYNSNPYTIEVVNNSSSESKAQEDIQIFQSAGFKIKCVCKLQENTVFIKAAKAQGANNIIGAYICAENEDDPETGVIININIYDESESFQKVKSEFHKFFKKKLLEKYADNMDQAGISYNYIDFHGETALEYTFDQYGVPTKALMFYKNQKSYLLQITTRNNLSSKYNTLKNSFQIF